MDVSDAFLDFIRRVVERQRAVVLVSRSEQALVAKPEGFHVGSPVLIEEKALEGAP
jgi:hypothetical protein